MRQVLIIGQDLSKRERLSQLLKKEEVGISSVEDGIGALDLLQTRSFDLIFSDLQGIQRLKRSKLWPLKASLVHLKRDEDPHILEIAQTLIPPLDAKKVKNFLQNIKREHLKVIAESSQMKQVLHQVEKVAKSHSNIFISGESGTGKEIIAGMIHNLSKRATHPFVCVNCAALSDTLIESEFFGHEKGAFTGAFQKRIGRFELANLGSLLLDEVSEIPASLQAKLLRVVQEQEFERVGGMHSVHVDVRLISTSNRNMKETINLNNFRKDLYYRLNVVPIYLPPLRERKEDILPLAKYFLKEVCNTNQIPMKTLSAHAQNKLLNYSWAGNIRELRNVIEYGVVMNCSEQIEEEHLCIESDSCSANPYITLKELEKQHILHTLQRWRGNRTKAAQILGISVRTLRNKLKLYH